MQSPAWLRPLLLGAMCGIGTSVVVICGTTVFAPRRMEGARSVVAIPWEIYAAIPVVAGILLILLGMRLLHARGQRLPFLITGALAFLLCLYSVWHLLWRDYIGKF